MRSMEQVRVAEKTVRMTTTFGGYNHREIINDGECFDMQNMSADLYPAMSTRRKRGIAESEETLHGIAGRSALVLIQGEKVYYGGEDTGLTVSTDEDMLPKQIVSLGAYVCIWPDKVFFNTHDFSDKGSMERRWINFDYITPVYAPTEPYENAPVIQLCRGDGTDYDMTEITTAKTAPKNPEDGKLWIDTSGDADVLRQWSSDRKEWTEVPTVYVKISAPEIGKDLKQYDSVMIRNLGYEKYWTGAANLATRVKNQLKDINGSAIVYFCGENYIVIAGMLRQTVNCYINLEVNRETPFMDYMCESNNRIWGCRFGMNRNRKIVEVADGRYFYMHFCDKEGNVYTSSDLTVSDTEPEDPADGDLWLDTHDSTTDVLYKWDEDAEEWKTEQGYISITAVKNANEAIPLHEFFEAGDYVELSGIIGEINDPFATTTDKQQAQAQALNKKSRVIAVGSYDPATQSSPREGFVVVEGIIEGTMMSTRQTGNKIKIINTAAKEGDFVNEIRACALGDFRNWSKYMGMSTDSYAASVGTDGVFTGAAAQAGYPVFFKENCIHKLYGTAPNSFQITTIMCRGVQKGSGRSVAVVNETILYKGLSDVMYFDGNMPQSIGENLGDVYYEDARAGAVNGKYYISMRHGDEWSLFVYDTKKGIWTREDDTRALGFATVGDELYLIDEENNTLVTVNGTAGTQESGPIEWEAVMGISGIEYVQGSRADMHNHLYMSRFDMRLKMDEGAEADLWIEYDSDGNWEHKGTIRGNRLGIFVLPVIPKRCDHLRAKLTGTGGFRIMSLSRILEVGSDG